MDTPVNFDNDVASQYDDYLAQSRALEDLYLKDHGLTREMLQALPEKQKRSILKSAQDFASEKITRYDAMVRLGQRDIDTKPESQPRRPRGDRVEKWLFRYKK